MVHIDDQILEYLNANHNFGMRIEVSREDVLLDTGGGLKKAAHFFLEDSKDSGTPFLLHNVDVVSTIDLRRMERFHIENRALVTIAMQKRTSSRYLLFDEHSQLCGRRSASDQQNDLVQSSKHVQPLAFSGIHVISPRFLNMMSEEGAFSIIAPYLRLAAQGEKIVAFRADEFYWRDLGRAEDLVQAAQDMHRGDIL